jgi:peptidoglycan/LPS O-acetylase OafA/YrhL
MIRGLAALYVAIGHAKVVFWSGGQDYIAKYPVNNWHIGDYLVFALDIFSSAAQEFVVVFFVLSGFFIALSFEKNNWSFKDFFVNRIIRIYPPYLFSLFIGLGVFTFINFYNPFLFSGLSDRAILVRITNSYNEMDFEGFVKALFFLPKNDYLAGNISYWSLLPEWIFYLTIPLLISKKHIAMIIFGVCYFVNFFGIAFENELLKFIFEYGFYFFFGTFILTIVRNSQWLRNVPSKQISYLIVMILFISTIGLGVLELKPYSTITACLLTAASIITLITYPIKGTAFKIGEFLGDISYSLYILHLPIYYFLYSLLTKAMNTEVFYNRIYWFAVPLAVIFSWLSYLMIERNTMKYIDVLKSKRKKH